ncbi:redoxin family protein [Steroidobacter sp.]|uniref:redoxin family protein n=1 Tax=Steroidobacter sp. TaxID=1978227 RepID=UPI001A421536|nr:redoxin domain-containing protein [Steroidobacter sp.]MBL8266857.1 redoxin domain-containing protein [Steroidobacter sp.]
MRNLHRAGIALASLLLGSQALAAADVADNFRLTDHLGVSHELYYLSDMKAVVLLAQGNGCDTSRQAAGTVQALQSQYEKQGVTFLAINSNLNDSLGSVGKEATQADIKLPILLDTAQLVGESLNLTRNGEVLVLNTKGWKIAYRGNASGISGALDAVIAGKPAPAATAATGCEIKMPERDKRNAHAKISYEKEVAPLLIDKCVVCHRQGGIGPWQMSSYDMIRGFSPMIREVVRTQRMPPWHADPHYGVFHNDRGLSAAQAKTLVHWIEAGSPRGAGADPLLSQRKDWPQWALGQPDLVVELPPFTTPATGTIPYQNIKIENPLDHAVWVRAVDFLPGQRAVLHHIIASAGGETRGNISLNNYVPGAEPLQVPKDNGILLPAKTKLHFQVHYTPNGQALTDVTRMGLYFMKDPPKYNFRSMIFINPRLKIPANTKVHVEKAERKFDQDAVIFSLHPHAHFRGKSSSFVAHYPDGREEMLLNIPVYDFNWQSTYDLSKPLNVPAGTRIVYTQVFDNSVQNKANPDPNREVTWGEQTWEEMVFGVIRYRNVKEDQTAPKTTEPNQAEVFSDRPST